MQTVLIRFRAILFFALILSIFYGSDVFSDPNSFNDPFTFPFSAEHQKILDDVVKKFNAGNPGDYKGYTVHKYSPFFIKSTSEDKEIFVNRETLFFLSEEELKFELGYHVAYISTNKNRRYIADQAVERAKKHRLGCVLSGSAAVGIPTFFVSRYNDFSSAVSIVFSMAAGLVGSWIGQKVADRYCDPKEYVSSDSQKLIYELDAMSVQTLGCYKIAINYFSKLKDIQYPPGEIKYIPSNKDRITRIEELSKERQQ